MEEHLEVRLTQKEALRIIKQKIRNRKIKIIDTKFGITDICNDNVKIEISSALYSSWVSQAPKEYYKVNITIITQEYPHIRRKLKNFDVKNGDYKILIGKIKWQIQEDIKKKELQGEKETQEQTNIILLAKKLKGLGARKEKYSGDYSIKNKYFDINFYPTSNGINICIEEKEDLTLDQAIELIKKLKEIK